MHKIGIILVNYNGFRDTKECILSLLSMNYDNIEIIVVDNNSTDSSVEELKKYSFPRCNIIKSNNNKGFSGGNNIGIKYAKSIGCDFVWLLNNDTYVDADCLNYMMECERKYNNNVVVSGKIYYAKNNRIWYAGGECSSFTGRTIHYGINNVDGERFDKKKRVTFISGCCMLIPMQIIHKIGLMAEEYFLYCEDLDYSCSLLKNGYKLIYEPGAHIYHKVNASTGKVANMTTYYMVRNKRIIIRKYFSGFRYVLARLYAYLEETKRVIKGEYSSQIVNIARRDYRRGIVGEYKGKF